jgi:hypothetical protein
VRLNLVHCRLYLSIGQAVSGEEDVIVAAWITLQLDLWMWLPLTKSRPWKSPSIAKVGITKWKCMIYYNSMVIPKLKYSSGR